MVSFLCFVTYAVIGPPFEGLWRDGGSGGDGGRGWSRRHGKAWEDMGETWDGHGYPGQHRVSNL